MLHCISGSDSFIFVVDEHPFHQVYSFICYHVLILFGYQRLYTTIRIGFQNLFNRSGNCDLVPTNVLIQFFSSEDLRDLNKLIFVIFAFEHGIHFKEHASHRAPKTPHIKRIMIELIIDQEFRPLIVSRCYSHIIFLAVFVEISESPIDKSELLCCVIDYDIDWFDIPVHNTHCVRVFQSL